VGEGGWVVGVLFCRQLQLIEVGGERGEGKQVPSSCSLGEMRRIRQSLSLDFGVASNEGCFPSSSLLCVLFIIVSPAFGSNTNVRHRSRVFLKSFLFCFPGNYVFSSNLSHVVCFLPKFIPLWG